MGAQSVSASTASWTTADGITYHLTLTINRQFDQNGNIINKLYRDVVLEDADIVYHENGNTTPQMVVFPFPFTVSIAAEHTPTQHDNYLAIAIDRESLYSSFSYSVSGYTSMELPTTYATGYYQPAIRFFGHSGSWTVTTGIGLASVGGTETCAVLPGDLVGARELYYAPDGEVALTFSRIE